MSTNKSVNHKALKINRKRAQNNDSPLRLSRAKSRRYILNDHTKFIITEAYKSARTNLIFSLSTSDNKVIVFTSSSPAEGKSTTCINMAISLATTGAKVLLIDSDLRKPSTHALLKLDKSVGLSSILSGMCTVAEAIHSNVRENLDVIVAGPLPPNPAELIGSNNTVELLEVLKKHYDYICIDTPPVNVVSDSQLYNSLTAGIVFILRDGYTTHNDLQRALNSIALANGKVLGFIKTACQSIGTSTGGSRVYGKAGYGYSYRSNETDSSEKD